MVNINDISSCGIREAMEAEGVTEIEYAGFGYTNPDDCNSRVDFYWIDGVLAGDTNGNPVFDDEARRLAVECGIDL